jgi:hypothetical protein
MTDLITARGFGLEEIERQVHIILYEQLNDELDVQEEIWYEDDEEFAATVGSDLGKTFLEHIEPHNFYSGHRPSLLQGKQDKFPNVAVMCYTAKNEERDRIDQMQNWSVNIDIEVMVKSEENEEEVNRRMHRTLEAINQVMFRNERLNGYSIGFISDPEVEMTNIFIQSEEVSHGENWYWSAAIMRYNIIRNSKFPLGA